MSNWVHFSFTDGSNPYIAKGYKSLWEMICKYDVEQTGEKTFLVLKPRKPWRHNYENCKAALWDFVTMWKWDLHYSYEELEFWRGFFATYGKKYGLMREFHENCIC